MRRSPIGLLIIGVLITMALVSAGAISWSPTPWETHAAHTVAKAVGKAAKSVGIRINIPPKPPWESPSHSTSDTPTTQNTSQAKSVQQLYPTGTGAAVTAPQAQPAITSAYCRLEGIPSGTDGCP